MKRKGMATWALVLIIVGIFIIILGLAGYLGWRYVRKAINTANPTPTATISAPTATPTKTSTPKPSTSKSAQVTATPTQSSSNTDNAALISLCQSQNPGATCAVTKIDGNYATGTASQTGGGAAWYAKKVNGTWTMVVPGTQNDPPCADTADFPKSIVPTCM